VNIIKANTNLILTTKVNIKNSKVCHNVIVVGALHFFMYDDELKGYLTCIVSTIKVAAL